MSELTPCYHCGLPCDDTIQSTIAGTSQNFCCFGCQAVADTIVSGGLGAFYRHREGLSTRRSESSARFTDYDLPDVQEEFVAELPQGRRQAHFYLSGITCAACVWLIEKHLARVLGVTEVQVNSATHAAVVTYRPDQVKLSTIMDALHRVGYPPQPFLERDVQRHWQAKQRGHLMRLGVAGIAMMQSGMVAVALHAGAIQGMEPIWVQILRWVNLLFTLPVVLYSAVPFYRAALSALKARHLVMDVSVSLALLLAFSASFYATLSGRGDVYFDSVAMFTFFLLLGRYFENRVRWQNFRATSQSRQLLPLTVEILRDSGRRNVPLKSVRSGDRVWVAAGSVVPCDGIIAEGSSEIDESILTGEALPKSRGAGDVVYAGSHNGATAIVVKSTAIGDQTQLAAIEHLVAQAEQTRPRQVALADRIAARFVAAVLLIVVVVTFVWYWIDASRALWVALSVLVVTCPCALSLATPTALTAAINHLRRRGILVTAAHSLESLNTIDTVVFDKTGTLTSGDLEVDEVILLTDSMDRNAVLALATALEQASHHPIAQAFAGYSSEMSVTQHKVESGCGVGGTVNGICYRFGRADYALPSSQISYPSEGLWLLLSDTHRPLAWVKLRDELRESAKVTIDRLAAMGLSVVLMSGDRKTNVASAAEALGIRDWHASMLPQDKLNRVRQMQSEGLRILMLGDGINDVPVLSGADVSCAMGSATNLAQTKADCVLLNDDLRQIPSALALARRTRRVIKQNLSWAVAYNLVVLPAAVCGMIPPWLAAIGMSSSSLVVVFNALRVG